ncbi:MAG: hypothetical protein LQ342_001621 [Letrouitia transgressa]|nr:MAG: hypothetical protein LQ342_001621 [Letrouitia transgressa]
MSAASAPITLHRFAEAIADLPLGNLHAKAAELRNSITHLESSNEQLRQYAAEGDRDCADAVRENQEVIQSMGRRIEYLRREVETRGFRWEENERNDSNEISRDLQQHVAQSNGTIAAQAEHLGGDPISRGTGSNLSNGGPNHRLREYVREDGVEPDATGVHL